MWITKSQRDEVLVNGASLVLIDVRRQVSFAADGAEVVTYLDGAAAVQGASGEPIGQVTHSGELRFQVSTEQAGTITFEATGGDLTATFDISGESFAVSAQGGTDPVAYTCTDTELVESADGYRAVFIRAT